MAQEPKRVFGVNSLLLLIAVVLFILAACGVSFGSLSLAWTGMAFFAAAHLV